MLYQSAAHVVGTIPRIECFPVQPLEPLRVQQQTDRLRAPFGRPTRLADAGDGTGQVVRARARHPASRVRKAVPVAPCVRSPRDSSGLKML